MHILRSPYTPVAIPDNLTLPDYFLSKIQRFSDATALEWPKDGTSFTFKQIGEIVDNLTVGFHQLGIKHGDFVATLLSNCPSFLFCFISLQRLGAVVTTCNPAYTIDEIETQFLDSRVKYVITQQDQMTKIESLKHRIKSLLKVILKDGPPHSNASLDQLMRRSRGKRLPKLPILRPKEDVAFVLYSSGTTGLPKGVMLTHYAMIANCIMTSNMHGAPEQLQLTPKDAAITVFPFFHAAGILNLTFMLTQGVKMVIVPKYEPEQFLGLVEKYRLTTLYLPPPITIFLTKSPIVEKFDLTSVKTIYNGGASLPKEVAIDVKARLNVKNIIQLYGMTELGPVSHMNPITHLGQAKIPSVGLPIPNVECMIIDPDTQRACSMNERGELWIRTPSVMKGYLNKPDATRNTITPDGWLKTGDIAIYDEDEYIYVVDRLKELIKVRGFQVAPNELEAHLLTHPSIAEAMVIGITDSYSGELPRAYIVRKDGATVTAEDIHAHMKGHLASYKQLAAGVRFIDELPKTTTGKLLRRTMRDRVRMEEASDKTTKAKL